MTMTIETLIKHIAAKVENVDRMSPLDALTVVSEIKRAVVHYQTEPHQAQYSAVALTVAFDKAEQETADMFMSATCSMPTKDGDNTCPIYYFRKRTRAHLDGE